MLLASPASAHTSLVGSVPANRAVLDTPPTSIRLVFRNKVEPDTVAGELIAVEGPAIGAVRRTTPASPSSATVEFSLPPLADGIYGFSWVAVGPDGHRVTGEVVFGVNTTGDAAITSGVSSASFGDGAGGDQLLDGAATASRGLWYTGTALAVGGLWLVAWALRRPGEPDGVGPAAQALVGFSSWLRWGVGLAACGAVARWAVSAVTVADVLDDGRGFAARLVEVSTDRNPRWWVLTTAVLLLTQIPARRLAAARTWDRNTRWQACVVALGLVAAAVLATLGGHASSYSPAWLSVPSSSLHLLAAALWVGPLAIVTLVALTARWRESESPRRRAYLTSLFRAYAPLGGAAFAVLAVTGARAISVTVGWEVFSSDYGWVLAAKLAVVLGVVTPLALHHDRQVCRAAASMRRAQAAAEAGEFGLSPAPSTIVGDRRFLQSVRIETVALLLVMGLGATLIGLDPGSGGTDPAAAAALDEALLGGGPVTDVSTCTAMSVGQKNCYRDYFFGILKKDGATAAVTEVQRLYDAGDEYVKFDCHQVVHQVGEDAINYYGSLAKAFSYEGSACWSGYYHGIVETKLAALTDEELRAELPTFCQDAIDGRPYAFPHYNCVHGMGHGLMLDFKGDLFKTLEYCELVPDQWEMTSCVGGAFMENIVSAQISEAKTALRDDDLLYPCNVVADKHKYQCYQMQTSYILWKNGYDYDAAFGLCDTLTDEWRQPCYVSMGRDISGNNLLAVDKVLELCAKGDERFRDWCYQGAAMNAVFNDHNTVQAYALCDAVEPRWRESCRAAAEGSASTL